LTLHTPVQLVAVNAPFSWFAHHHKTRKEKDMSCARALDADDVTARAVS